MAYLPPPPPPSAPRRRPPRWSTTPVLSQEIAHYVGGEQAAGRRIRRILAPPLADLADAAIGSRASRHRVSQTAVTIALAALETGLVAPRGTAVVFTAVAQVLTSTGHSTLEWLATLAPWERALLRLLDVELADPDGVARAFGLEAEELRRHRATVAEIIDLARPRESTCPGWPAVRAALRRDEDGAWSHRRTCGRCTLVAEQTVVRRRRLWHDDEPVGDLAAPFEPRRR